MKTLLTAFIVFGFLFTSYTQSQTTNNQELKKDNFQIKAGSITSGGIIGSNNINHKLSASAGQLAIDSIGNNQYSIYFGFWYQYPNIITALDFEDFLIPKTFDLKQNYPNPFNPETTIEYAVPRLGDITIEVFNVLGQKVGVLLNEKQNPGFYKIKWSGINYSGNLISNGVYFYRMVARTSEGKVYGRTKKMIFLK